MLTIDKIKNVSRNQIEDRVFKLLKLELTDLDDYCDVVIPDGYPRFYLYRNGKLLGHITTSNGQFHTRMANNQKTYNSLYQASTFWIEPSTLADFEQRIERELSEEYEEMPDYI